MSRLRREQQPGAGRGVTVRVVTVRTATAADEAFLHEMLYHSLHVPAGAVPFPREVLETPEIARYVKGWGRPGDLGLLATEPATGKAIGAVWMRRFSEDEPGYGFVAPSIPELGMAVLPGHRGQGVGSTLLGRLLEAASVLYSAVSLSVAADNPARRLYERLGFEVAGGDGDSLTMVKRLEGSEEGSESAGREEVRR